MKNIIMGILPIITMFAIIGIRMRMSILAMLRFPSRGRLTERITLIGLIPHGIPPEAPVLRRLRITTHLTQTWRLRLCQMIPRLSKFSHLFMENQVLNGRSRNCLAVRPVLLIHTTPVHSNHHLTILWMA